MKASFDPESFGEYLEKFSLEGDACGEMPGSITNLTSFEGRPDITKYTNEFWTSKQRQASSIHEVSYRACFKPQLPRFFIDLLTDSGDVVYDPFTGRNYGN
ncbi:hypothetical protein [Methanochimaera problematica]|uniref:hypothetical protein n=1 Tax=Methanochimaera problematica TaxID=2609417 RepID=UPI002938D9DA|nr:hypothetical protein [Methanoplanus sp. FWC-SCC4]